MLEWGFREVAVAMVAVAVVVLVTVREIEDGMRVDGCEKEAMSGWDGVLEGGTSSAGMRSSSERVKESGSSSRFAVKWSVS